MIKKILVVPVLLAAMFMSYISVGVITIVMRNKPSSDLVPIETITGINETVTLKNGCVVTSGICFPSNDDGVRCHCARLSAVVTEIADMENGQATNPGLPVDDLRIIDVYGDKCTLVFKCTDDKKLYSTTDYPLANLNYNEAKVIAANDGIRTNLIGSRYTLDYSISGVQFPRNIVLVTVLLIGTWVVAVVLIKNLIKSERE